MRFVPLLLSASLIAVIRTTEGYVSDVNPRLTTVGSSKKMHVVTIQPHSRKHHQVRARDNDRIIFPSTSSQGDLGQNPDQRIRASRGEHTDGVLPGDSNVRGSFTNGYPSTHSMQLKRSFSNYRAPVHPFERDNEDDGPIWQD